MNQLKKIAGKFFGKKGSKESNTPIGKLIGAKLKVIKYAIAASVTSFFTPVIIILAVVAFFIGFVQENTDRIENLLRGGCLFCSNEELEEMKENQFYTKIRIIKQTAGNKVDDVVLASTILFLGQYNDMLDSLYDEDFNEDDFGAKMTDLISSLSVTGSESYNGISQEQIDLLDAATIVMINSNVDGKYNEESYKKALASPGFGSDNWFVNGTTCIVNAIFDTNGILQNALPLVSFITGDGNLADKTIRFLNTVDICSEGFIGGAIDSVKNISDPEAKQRKKNQVAQEIIDFSKFYRSLFPEDECLYAGNVGTGDMTNWRQCGASWSDKSLGGTSSVCRIGCTATSMSYLIAKSGTQLTVSSFDPGVFVDNASFDDGALIWDSWQGIAPNFIKIEQNVPVNNSNAASVLSEAISKPCNGDKQPYIVLYLSKGHWVAFDHVENGTVYVMDPSANDGAGLVPLEKAHKGDSLYSYNKFCANDVNFGSTGSSSGSGNAASNSAVTKYLKAMKSIADDDTHGYSMASRTGPDYDCSSFVYYALVEAGILSDDGYPFATGNMGQVLVEAGFQEIPYDINNLQTGDILVDTRPGASGHTTTIYSTQGGTIQQIAAHGNYDGKSGDSSGKEININEYSEGTHNYKYIYRLSGASGSDLCIIDSVVGEIIIPEEYGNGGYTVTFYSNSDNTWNWAEASNQGKLYYDYWLPSGATYDNGIATYEGRYLIACTTTYGDVGDKVDFYLSDGTKIPCIIADIKNPSDPGCNEWGHSNGQNVIEFEVSRDYYNKYGNPGNNGWFSEWGGKRVASASNLGSIW